MVTHRLAWLVRRARPRFPARPRRARNAAGEQSSSGFTTITRPWNWSARRAIEMTVLATRYDPHAPKPVRRRPGICRVRSVVDDRVRHVDRNDRESVASRLGRYRTPARRVGEGLCVASCAALEVPQVPWGSNPARVVGRGCRTPLEDNGVVLSPFHTHRSE